MKKYFSIFTRTLLIFSFMFIAVGCGDDNDDPNDPTNSVPDPIGTIPVSVRNYSNGGTYFGLTYSNYSSYTGSYYTSVASIGIDKADNFYCNDSRVSFVSLGSLKGLGNVTKVPTSGWAKKVSVVPGYGYIVGIWAESDDGTSVSYARVYVVDYITNASGGVLGADIKYQYPFVP